MNIESRENIHNPYEVKIDYFLPKDINKVRYLAFIVNKENFTIFIGDGHEKIIDRYNLSDQDYRGGNIYPVEKKISFRSPSLGDIDDGGEMYDNQCYRKSARN
ncbi:MAG: hypothetical protein AAB593_02060 [Patescibacteria group bacterium]